MWIDYDGDCNYESTEEVDLKTSTNNDNPFVIEEHDYGNHCEKNNTHAESTYDVPESKPLLPLHFAFNYKFTIPSSLSLPINNGIFRTTARILLRWEGWPSDPSSDYIDSLGCGSWWGDVEEYSITLINS
jgi:hypothetical protein